MAVKKRFYFIAVIIFIVISAVPVRDNELKKYEPEILKSYIDNPSCHPNIPDNSYAGFAYGEKEIPVYPVAVRASEFGAKAGNAGSSSKAISEALKAAFDKGGGAVLLDEGEYLIDDEIFIHYDNVVLRGAGAGRTILKIEGSLSGTYKGPNNRKIIKNSEWTTAGGFIWFSPYDEMSAGKVIMPWETGAGDIFDADIKRGSFNAVVKNGGKFRTGDKAVILFENDDNKTFQREMCRDIEPVMGFKNEGNDPKVFRTLLQYPVEITAADDRQIKFKQPLRLGVRKGTGIFLIRRAVCCSGIENLTIVMKDNEKWIHHKEAGYNAIYFNCAWNCWIRDVDIRNWETAVSIINSKCITAKNIRLGGKGRHNAVYCARCSDALITDFKIEPAVKHGITLDVFSNGNVFSGGQMMHGTFDYHRGLAFDNIITDVVINNDGIHGGLSAPCFGVRNVHWNITVTNGRSYMISPANLMPCGAVIGVRGCGIYNERDPDYKGALKTVIEGQGMTVVPGNLYFEQLDIRLGGLRRL